VRREDGRFLNHGEGPAMLTGRCQCGEVPYDSADAPIAFYGCHCLECRRQSASTFGMSYAVPSAGLRVTPGAPQFTREPEEPHAT